MDLPLELLRFETVQYLPIQDILHLCQSFPEICQDESLWRYLVQRDFHYDYQGLDPRKEYEYAQYIHDMSDIPVKDVVISSKRNGVSFSDMVLILKKYGFNMRGDVFEWNKIPKDWFTSLYKTRIVHLPYVFTKSRTLETAIGHEISTEYNNKIIRVLQDILPKILTLEVKRWEMLEGPDMDEMFIYISPNHLDQIADFYEVEDDLF